MTKHYWFICGAALGGLLAAVQTSSAQGSAFTYQGRLSSNGNPVNGVFDLRFALYDSPSNTTGLVSGPVTNSAVPVAGGLFATTLDFGAVAFGGADRWLEISVGTGGLANFTTLTPRQKLTPAPYAIFANSTSNLTGTLNFGSLSTSAQAAITNVAAGVAYPSNLVVICEGDSQTSLQPDGTDWPTLLQTLFFCSNRVTFFADVAVGGTGISDATNRYVTLVKPHKPAAGQKGYYLIYIGVNDLRAGYSVQSWGQIYSNLCVQARSDGFTVMAMTFPPDAEPRYHSGYPGTSTDLFRKDLNSWLRTAVGVWDILVDLERTCPNPYDSQFLEPDYLHLNEAGRALVASLANNALTADAQIAVAGTPYWQQQMPLVRAPWATTNWVSAASPGQDWSMTSPFLVDALLYKSNGSPWTSLGWQVPYGFTNVAATITLAPTNVAVPVTLAVDLACDVPGTGSRTVTHFGPTNITAENTFQKACFFTTNNGVRSVMLYFWNATLSGPVTNSFYLKQVQLTGY
jgi:lysophospholipase L1-like esterase